MKDNNDAEDEREDAQPKPVQLRERAAMSSTAVEEGEERHLLAQLFAALTARWRDEEGHLRIGVSQRDLLEALHTSRAGLNQLLERLIRTIEPLGLELVEYRVGREVRYCIRTLYGVPGELTDPEYAVLGLIIAGVERAAARRHPRVIRTKDLERNLVATGRLSRYHLDRILRRLADLGYITRGVNRITYGPRTEIEFDSERRQAIAARAQALIGGLAVSTVDETDTSS